MRTAPCHDPGPSPADLLQVEEALAAGERVIQVALAGQPNVGKSTIFNLLTGLNQHVGNWPGKTVERKVGTYRHNGRLYRLTDLPGTYSLTASSEEERIARDFILREQPDVVVAVVDAAVLERSLYLLAELLMLPQPVVLALNMVDVARQRGIEIEPHVLEAALGIPVVPMVASRGQGVRELLDAVEQVALEGLPCPPSRPTIREDHQAVLQRIVALIHGAVPPPYPEDWAALKLLEGDEEVTTLVQAHLPPERWGEVHRLLMQHEDAVLAVAGARYDWIRRMVRAAVVQPRAGRITQTDRLDRIATHPVWGIFLLLLALGALFWVTYTLGAPVQAWLDEVVIQGTAARIRQALAGAPPWLLGLLADGVLGGAGMVVTFVPILAIFFAALGFLEDTGYMARAAYVMDRFMHLMGLHGKSFLPLFLGFGCNVPAVMGARIVDTPQARLLTILLAPLVPCTARLAVLAVLAPIFFGGSAALVSWGLVALNLAVLVVLGIVVHELILGGEHVAFIMELPLYHAPNWRTIGIGVWQRLLAFLQKAGTIILVVSVVVWVLSYLPYGDIRTGYLALAGRWLDPVGRLMGLRWEMMVALLTSFVAKENTIATLGILFGVGEAGEELAKALQGSLPPAAALAFLVTQMLFIPCVATTAAIRQETGSWKWTLASLGLLLTIALGGGVAIYQVARLLGWGT
ncbi:MAG: ferrous iron transport protein B [Anaerolineae bacterium]